MEKINNKYNITVGSDPEIFICDDIEIVKRTMIYLKEILND